MEDQFKMKGLGLVEPLSISLKDKFIIPPFSVLNARDGDWQTRKRQWLKLGIKSDAGRDAKAFGDASERQNKWSDKNKKFNAKTQKALSCMFADATIDRANGSITPTSIFDPVLCELAYRWFCPTNGKILDPFAGGSVRGITAAILEKSYTGIDLREEQISANKEQWKSISAKYKAPEDYAPNWITGDSRDCKKIAYNKYDFIFSCPPYGNLEVYSDDPQDLSNLDYDEFLSSYKKIIKRSCQMLKNNRFACFVVGDFRDKKGMYRNFPADTIQAFLDSGLSLYNEIILVTAVGSLPIRVGKQFTAGRKVGKTHQNIFVFYKGDNHKDIKSIEF